jgi:CRISPR/Cas system-associated exonuclease Cas4 (RecB family)
MNRHGKPKREILCECKSAIINCPTHGNGLAIKLLDGLATNRFQPKPGIYHVTEICGCLRRSYLERTNGHDETYREVWIKQRGNALHRQVGYAFQGWKELAIRMQIHLSEETVTLVGHVDAYDPDRAEMTEFKSTRFLKWQQEHGKLPHRHHVMQLLAYYSIWTRCYGFPVKKLFLAYMDDETPPMPFEIRPRDTADWLGDRVTRLHKSMAEDRAPEAEVGPLCNYCAFQEFCGVKPP